jgi:N-acetylmuramoyl-L-alanine amidase
MKTVFISAGHGGGDSGAVAANGLTEASLALALRDVVATELLTLGVPVVEDGRDNINLPLRDALTLMRDIDGPKVEFHWNAAANKKATGIEALCHPQNKELAKALCMAISTVTQLPLRGDFGWRPANAGQHHRLAFCEAGGVILEVCFISNVKDLVTYQSKRAGVAVAIAQVLKRFADV